LIETNALPLSQAANGLSQATLEFVEQVFLYSRCASYCPTNNDKALKETIGFSGFLELKAIDVAKPCDWHEYSALY